MKFVIVKLKGVGLETPWMIICPDGMIYFEVQHWHCVVRMDLVAGALGVAA